MRSGTVARGITIVCLSLARGSSLISHTIARQTSREKSRDVCYLWLVYILDIWYGCTVSRHKAGQIGDYMTRKNEKWRPYDVQDAISRAVQCRVMRDQTGLTLEQLATIGGVTVRSASRWESPIGAGSCPDDVLGTLTRMIMLQRQIVADTVAYAEQIRTHVRGTPVRPCPGGQAPVKGAEIPPVKGGEMSPVKEAAISQNAGEPVKGGAIPMGEPVKGVELPDVELTPDVEFDSNGDATITYWPTQRIYDDCNPNTRGWYSAINANARACALALEEIGVRVTWRYPELV